MTDSNQENKWMMSGTETPEEADTRAKGYVDSVIGRDPNLSLIQCNGCGMELDNDWNYCPSCGRFFGGGGKQ